MSTNHQTKTAVDVGFKFMTHPMRISLVLVAVALSGCGTIGTLGEPQTRNKVFSGTIRDIQLQGAHGTCLDLPFSLVADAVVLPATIPWSLYNVFHNEPMPRETANPLTPNQASADSEPLFSEH